MTDRLKKLCDFTRRRNFVRYRSDDEARAVGAEGREQCRQTRLFCTRCADEKPVVLRDERIAFMRTRKNLAQFVGIRRFSLKWTWIVFRNLFARMQLLCHKLNPRYCPRRRIESVIQNTTADYAQVMESGFAGRIALAQSLMAGAKTGRQKEFLSCTVDAMNALLELVGRYAAEAERVGNAEVARMLRNVPRNRPGGFHEALQFLRICNFSQYLAGMAHCGLGRMDQYLWPYYKRDIDSSKMTRSEAAELLAEFFISLNRDSDLYPGIQQGDNGQSVMLGGCDPNTGESAVNDLTYLILEVAREVRLIDPKINVRIDRNTPLELLELGSRLTACGLGFPQYSNDDVVIPALVRKGYALEDARNYSVAACWEFVIPGKGADYVNAGAVSFPHAVDWALRREVRRGHFSEDRFRRSIKRDIEGQVKSVLRWNMMRFTPHPYLSALFDGAIEARCDFVECAKYHFTGMHGAGAANAADAMAAILETHAKKGAAGLKELLAALDGNFAHAEDLRECLVNEAPKVGTTNEMADRCLKDLFDMYADVGEKFRNFRPGSGSAMFYVWLADVNNRPAGLIEPLVGATSDGRLQNAPLGASLAPAHEAKVRGVMSVFRSFAGIDYARIMNGGPVTIELSHSVFDSPMGTTKLGQLIQYFAALGGQQLQLNVLDVNELEDAIKHPERHRNLIVRVWGWSGYFVELAPEYQRQIIKRHRYG